jgi:hypothetical protein
VSYVNSTGIALIIGLLAEARKSYPKLVVYGLSEHYVRIFRNTRLTDFVMIFPDEESALANSIGLNDRTKTEKIHIPIYAFHHLTLKSLKATIREECWIIPQSNHAQPEIIVLERVLSSFPEKIAVWEIKSKAIRSTKWMIFSFVVHFPNSIPRFTI